MKRPTEIEIKDDYKHPEKEDEILFSRHASVTPFPP
jgi:hypothetical protein